MELVIEITVNYKFTVQIEGYNFEILRYSFSTGAWKQKILDCINTSVESF